MALQIEAGPWSRQRMELEFWLADRSAHPAGVWRAGTAVAALEAWRVAEATPADMKHKLQLAQELQFARVLGVPYAPPFIKLTGEAYGDIWAYLSQAAAAAGGAAVDVPQPSQALCDEVVRRFWERTPKPLPPALDPNRPRKPRSFAPAVVLALVAMALAYTTTKGD